MAQIGTSPPRFAIQVNSRTRVTRDYAYFLENQMRERYALDGVPLIIDFVERGSRAENTRPRGSRRPAPVLSAVPGDDEDDRQSL
jgi:GTP-binding protein